MSTKTAVRAAVPKAAAQMQLSPAGATFLRLEEGFIDHWYADPTGTGTIGVGFTWLSDSFRQWWGENRPGQKFGPGAKMTRSEADDCLRFMVAREYGAAVNRFLGAVEQHVFDGAVSPIFNLGTGALKWKWAAALKAGDLKRAAALLRETGLTSKGVRLLGLVNRRKEEGELIALGDYTIGKVAADPLDDGMLVRGERGAPVLELQSALAAAGLYSGAPDGKFGFGTEAAVLAFQRAYDLEPDGWAGPRTLAALGLDHLVSDQAKAVLAEQAPEAAEEEAPAAPPPRDVITEPGSEQPSLANGVNWGRVLLAAVTVAALAWVGINLLT